MSTFLVMVILLNRCFRQPKNRWKSAIIYDLGKLASGVCDLMQVEPAELWAPGKEHKRVAARSLLCYWAVRDLGIGMAQIARRLNLSLPG